MKKILAGFLLLSLIMLSTASLNDSFAQPAPPPPPSQHGGEGNKAPAAPLEDGLEISFLLAVAYGGFILYKMRKRDKGIKLNQE